MLILKNFLGLFSRPEQVLAEGAEERDLRVTLFPILLTMLVLTTYPVINNLARTVMMLTNIIMIVLLISTMYLIACLAFLCIGKLFKRQVTFRQIFSSWSYSYYPNLGFALFMIISHTLVPEGVPVFELGSFFTLFLVTFLLFLLIWKLILFFVELRVILQLKILETLLASVILGVFYILFWVIVGNAIKIFIA